MTIEEKAELELKWMRYYSNSKKEMLRKASEQDVLPDYAAFELDFWREIYESGKQAVGKRNGIQWHDLRKNPKDLPKEENRIMLCYCCNGYHGNIGIYVYRLYTKKSFTKLLRGVKSPLLIRSKL